MRIPFFSKKNGQDRGLHFKNSNITGDVSIDSVGEGSDAIGVDLFNSNITGNITINYNGGTEALEEKIDSILHNLRDTMEKQHPNEATTFANDFEEVQNVVNHEPAVPSAVDSMKKLARVLRESGYYAESNQVQIDIAELMIETDSVVTQIHGIIHLCQNSKIPFDWFVHLRRALKLAIENDLEKEKFLVHTQLFMSYERFKYTSKQEDCYRLLNNILSDASYFTMPDFKKNYRQGSSSYREVVKYMSNYMTYSRGWKKYDPNRFFSKRLVARFEYVMDGYFDKSFVKNIKRRLLYPKTNFLLEFPGFFWEVFFVIFTLGRYDPMWTMSITKSWAFTIIVAIGVWYFLI
ncbi:MAG: hypothetical protein ACPHDO_04685 [Candidatus Poseidoniaceae archaeon]